MVTSSGRRSGWMVAAVVAISTAHGARAEESDLAKEVAALKAEVAALKARENGNWLTERRAAEIKSLVREVLDDAQARRSFSDSGVMAGWNKHFFLASADNNFLLQLKGQIDIRYIWNNRNDGASSAPSDNDEAGFQLRRGKIAFSGHVFDPRLEYEIKLATERDTEGVYLEDMWVSYAFLEGWKVKGGRYKAPFLREELVSSSKQTAVERSSVNEFFTLNRGEGVGLIYEGDRIRAEGMLHDGAQSGEPGGLSNDFTGDATEYAVTGRLDLLLAGSWKQMGDFAAWSGEPLGAMLGWAVSYESGETGDGQATVAWDNGISATMDASVEFGGFNAYGALMRRHLDGAVSGMDFDDYGALVQAGYMVIPDKLEPFARYEWIRVDGGGAAPDADVNILTFGANYYFRKHDVKFTLDAVWALDPLVGLSRSPVTASGTSSGLGLTTDAAGADDQVAIRAQFQLLF